MGSLFIAILVIIVLVSLYYKSSDGDEREQKEKEKETIAILKARYQNALQSGDSAKARQHGREYYAYLRNSRALSPGDEQAIENDIAAIQ